MITQLIIRIKIRENKTTQLGAAHARLSTRHYVNNMYITCLQFARRDVVFNAIGTELKRDSCPVFFNRE